MAEELGQMSEHLSLSVITSDADHHSPNTIKFSVRIPIYRKLCTLVSWAVYVKMENHARIKAFLVTEGAFQQNTH